MRRSRSSATRVARESSESSSTRSYGARGVSHSPTVQRRRTTVGPTRKDQSQHGDGASADPVVRSSDERIERVAQTLRANNIEAIVVDPGVEARHPILELIREGAEVH